MVHRSELKEWQKSQFNLSTKRNIRDEENLKDDRLNYTIIRAFQHVRFGI